MIEIVSNQGTIDLAPMVGASPVVVDIEAEVDRAADARDGALAAKVEAEFARDNAEAARSAAQAALTATEAVRDKTVEISGLDDLEDGVSYEIKREGSKVRTALSGVVDTSVLPAPTDATPFRTAVRGRQITAARPLVPIGDSHTDTATAAANVWSRITSLLNQPGAGFEGLDPTALVVRGRNGERLSNYLANLGATNGWNSVVALNPSWLMPCWLTNDVRNGALGLTVEAIRAAGAELLRQLIDLARKDLPNARIVLRIPVPYTQQNSAGQNYITDGAGNVNPAGLAQIYTDGVRLAHYDAVASRPGVLLYDPQTRAFGTASPGLNGGANTGYYADQIHQNVNGYRAEADDMAAWISAQEPFSAAAAYDARIVQNPTAPWDPYHRVVEDPDRYVKVGEGQAVTVASGNTFALVGPTFPGLLTGNLAKRDIIVFYGAKRAIEIPATATIGTQAANTIVSNLGGALGFSAAQGTRVAVYRRTSTPDEALNAVLRNPAWRYKRSGYFANGGTTFVDLETQSYTDTPAAPGNLLANELTAGDFLYPEGRNTPLVIGVDTGAPFPQGGATRLQGTLQGIDWNTLKGKAFVVVSMNPRAGTVQQNYRNHRLGAAGDSITAFDGSAPTANTGGGAYHARAAAASQGRMVWGGARAVGGNTIAQIVDERIPELITAGFDLGVVVVLAGTNDMTALAGLTGAARDARKSELIAKLNAGYDRLLATGMRPVAATIPVRSNAAATETAGREWNEVVKTNAAMRGLDCVDFYAVTAASEGTWKTGYNLEGDDVHPSPLGHKHMGQALAAVLRSRVAPRNPVLATLAADPDDMLQGKGLFATDAASNAQQTANDGISDGWQSFSGTGCIFTRYQDAFGVWWQRITVPASASAGGLLQVNLTGVCAVGDRLRIAGRIRTGGLDPNATRTDRPGAAFTLVVRGASGNVAAVGAPLVKSDYVREGIVEQELVVPSGANGNLQVNLQNGPQPPAGAGDVYAEFAQVIATNKTARGIL